MYRFSWDWLINKHEWRCQVCLRTWPYSTTAPNQSTHATHTFICSTNCFSYFVSMNTKICTSSCITAQLDIEVQLPLYLNIVQAPGIDSIKCHTADSLLCDANGKLHV
jgi:hypothetical protein